MSLDSCRTWVHTWISMPRVGQIGGIVFYVYPDDHNPPHLHALYVEHEVLLIIATGAIYAGWMPSPQLAEARAWLAANKLTVMAKWLVLNAP
jgi:Domain of unknown function (DUF4160)